MSIVRYQIEFFYTLVRWNSGKSDILKLALSVQKSKSRNILWMLSFSVKELGNGFVYFWKDHVKSLVLLFGAPRKTTSLTLEPLVIHSNSTTSSTIGTADPSITSPIVSLARNGIFSRASINCFTTWYAPIIPPLIKFRLCFLRTLQQALYCRPFQKIMKLIFLNYRSWNVVS